MPKASPMPGRCWTLRMGGSKNSSRLKCGRPVAPSPWRIVPPPQRFSTRIGCIQSAIDFREFSPTAAGFLLDPLSPVSLMRRVHSASSSLRERRIGTDKRPAASSACPPRPPFPPRHRWRRWPKVNSPPKPPPSPASGAKRRRAQPRIDGSANGCRARGVPGCRASVRGHCRSGLAARPPLGRVSPIPCRRLDPDAVL